MTAATIGLIAGPQDAALIGFLEARFSISGLCLQATNGHIKSSLPITPDVVSLAADTQPAVCCFLAPYPGLADDMSACLESGSHVVSAGPPLLDESQYKQLQTLAQDRGLHLQWDAMHLWSPRHQMLSAQSLLPQFGTPVYLRYIRGGGYSLLAAWWAAVALYNEAADLLSKPARLLVNAHSDNLGHHQIVLTLQTTNGANAQLIVSPAPLPGEGHLSFLGTGAMLSDADPMATQTLITGDALLPTPEFPVHQAWLAGFVDQLAAPPTTYPTESAVGFHRRLLAAIEQAVAQGQAVALELT